MSYEALSRTRKPIGGSATDAPDVFFFGHLAGDVDADGVAIYHHHGLRGRLFSGTSGVVPYTGPRTLPAFDNVDHAQALESLAQTPRGTNLVLQKDGAGRLYYRVGMSYAPTNLKLAAADYGFAVTNTAYLLAPALNVVGNGLFYALLAVIVGSAIVAVGGGRCLDIAKLAAARAGLTMVAVPTQLSHDGICSPVAVVPDSDGRPESLGAIAPFFVYVSQPTLVTAPVESVAAGLGDLLANPLALRDWALAVERGLAFGDIDGSFLGFRVHRHETAGGKIITMDRAFLFHRLNADGSLAMTTRRLDLEDLLRA